VPQSWGLFTQLSTIASIAARFEQTGGWHGARINCRRVAPIPENAAGLKPEARERGPINGGNPWQKNPLVLGKIGLRQNNKRQ
jgi:hypothetical protein